MIRRKLSLALMLASTLFAFANTHAELVPRLRGHAVFDTDQNLTWLADTNFARTSGADSDGKMRWDAAVAWVENLSYGGVDSWRLPRLTEGCGGLGCVTGEIGRLYWQTFWNGNDLTPTETGKFTNLKTDAFYWYGSEVLGSPQLIRIFFLSSGFQGEDFRDNENYAWAVTDGDVYASAVPLPSSFLLMATSLLVLRISVRRRARASS